MPVRSGLGAFYVAWTLWENPGIHPNYGGMIIEWDDCIYIYGGFLKWWVSPTNPWVFLLKMTILGCFGDTTVLGNTHIFTYQVIQPPWPFHPLVFFSWRSPTTIEKGHVNSPSQKGHKDLPGTSLPFIYKYTIHEWLRGGSSPKRLVSKWWKLDHGYLLLLLLLLFAERLKWMGVTNYWDVHGT